MTTMVPTKWATLGFVALLLTCKSDRPIEPDAGDLQGVWEIVTVEREGMPDTAAVGFTLRFSGDEVHFQVPSYHDTRITLGTFEVKPRLRIPS